MMNSETLTKLSKVISYILHPFLLPSFMAVILLFGHTVMAVIPINIKLYFVAMTFLITLIIPALIISLMNTLHIIPNLSLNEREHRVIPLILAGICYTICYMIFKQVGLAFLLNKILLTALMCIGIAFIVNMFWKISLHMTAIGGMTGILTILNFSGFATVPYILLIFIILSGLLGSARLYLGSHNILQIGTGFLAGFTVSIITMLFT